MGALDYNCKKIDHPDIRQRAEILDSNFASFDYNMIKAEVDAVRLLRPNLSRYVYHTSLNFSSTEIDSLSNDKLLDIAHDYLNGLGYNNNQYIIFRHYDANHPHLHLLVNRVSFDGNVVTDGNNYKRSEAVVRQLEVKYDLIPLEQSIYKATKRDNHISIERNSHVSQKALKKNEIEKALRTGKPSDKMVLQEKLKNIIGRGDISLQELITRGEEQGIYFLFNQASTGYVSGITYFHNEFKAKGQALGNRFKWAELIKHINYEQDRDRQAVSEANERTTAKYGKFTSQQQSTGQSGRGAFEFFTGHKEDTGIDGIQQADFGEVGKEGLPGREGGLGAAANDHVYAYSDDYGHDGVSGSIDIQISDDIDDEAIHGRNRRRRSKPRTNTR